MIIEQTHAETAYIVLLQTKCIPLSPVLDGLLKHETHSYRLVSVVFISVFWDPSNKQTKKKHLYFEKNNSFIKQKYSVWI